MLSVGFLLCGGLVRLGLGLIFSLSSLGFCLGSLCLGLLLALGISLLLGGLCLSLLKGLGSFFFSCLLFFVGLLLSGLGISLLFGGLVLLRGLFLRLSFILASSLLLLSLGCEVLFGLFGRRSGLLGGFIGSLLLLSRFVLFLLRLGCSCGDSLLLFSGALNGGGGLCLSGLGGFSLDLRGLLLALLQGLLCLVLLLVKHLFGPGGVLRGLLGISSLLVGELDFFVGFSLLVFLLLLLLLGLFLGFLLGSFELLFAGLLNLIKSRFLIGGSGERVGTSGGKRVNRHGTGQDGARNDSVGHSGTGSVDCGGRDGGAAGGGGKLLHSRQNLVHDVARSIGRDPRSDLLDLFSDLLATGGAR